MENTREEKERERGGVEERAAARTRKHSAISGTAEGIVVGIARNDADAELGGTRLRQGDTRKKKPKREIEFQRGPRPIAVAAPLAFTRNARRSDGA